MILEKSKYFLTDELKNDKIGKLHKRLLKKLENLIKIQDQIKVLNQKLVKEVENVK